MSTKTDFYLGRGPHAHWRGSLQWDCEPDNLLAITPGRQALTSTDETTYNTAVTALLLQWESDGFGTAHPPHHGWPWPWNTSHLSSWIVAFDPNHNTVYITVGGGVAWHHIQPEAPTLPTGSDPLGPPDMLAWLHDPAAPPSVPLPLVAGTATRTHMTPPN